MLPISSNIAFAISSVVNENREKSAIIAADITVTYDRLWLITRSFAYKMRELGVGQNTFIMVRTRDMIASLATLYAAALLGARYTTYDKTIIDQDDFEQGQPDFLFHTPDEPAYCDRPSISIGPEWLNCIPADNGMDDFIGYSDADQPALLSTTSGTTGKPKHIWLTARQVYLRAKASQDDFSYGKTRFCALFPCNTRPFFVRANATLLSACSIVDTVDIEFMQREKVDLFCASPRTAIEWLNGRTIAPKLPLIQVSGARLEPFHIKTLINSFTVIEDVYGASETSKSHINRIEHHDRNIVVYGRKLDSKIEIIDEGGNIITEPNRPGLLRVANPYMNSNYVGDAKTTEKVLINGYFQSGDIAAWGERNELIILGRIDQLINLGGMKIDPFQIEAIIENVEGITGAAAIAVPRPLSPPRTMALVTVSYRAHADKTIEAVQNMCRTTLPGPAVPLLILVVDEIPRTGDGSPKRTQCINLASDILAKIETANAANHDQ